MPRRAPIVQLIAAFAAIYLIWGSTYLGIKLAIESMPPYFMAGSRFLLAGLLLLSWLLMRGGFDRRLLSAYPLLTCAAVGILMLGLGNGLVVRSIGQGAPTGLIAVLIAITPFWLVGIERLVEPTRRITARTVLGLMVGVLGIAILGGVLEGGGRSSVQVDTPTLLVMLVATLSWASGSMLSRYGSRGQRPSDGRSGSAAVNPLGPAALQMIFGGGALLLVSAVCEPWRTIDLPSITARAWLGYVYLVLCGSIIAYSAFIWLLRHVSAAAVGTYAYVNPVVAVFLGALVLGERLTLRTGVASGLILVAVVLITWPGRTAGVVLEQPEEGGAVS